MKITSMLRWARPSIPDRIPFLQSNPSPRKRQGFGERLVFVGGAPRSGTTLLQMILDSHSLVFGGPEFDRIPEIARTWRSCVHTLETGRIDSFCTRDQIDRTFGELIEKMLLPAADVRGCSLLSEKTPFNVLVFCELLEMLPRCRVIQIVRDPRAVVSSMLAVGKRSQAKGEPPPEFVRELEAAVRFTRQCLDAGILATGRFPERTLTVRYESLIKTPEPEVRRICEFLHIDFETKMLRPNESSHPEIEAVAMTDNGIWIDPALGFRAIEDSRICAWQTNLTPQEIQYINLAFHHYPHLLNQH